MPSTPAQLIGYESKMWFDKLNAFDTAALTAWQFRTGKVVPTIEEAASIKLAPDLLSHTAEVHVLHEHDFHRDERGQRRCMDCGSKTGSGKCEGRA